MISFQYRADKNLKQMLLLTATESSLIVVQISNILSLNHD